MTLQTDLSRKPYFDDWTANSSYYRILYKPGVAVQARELNQTQSMLQEQIGRFGRSVYKEGSIVEGCVFSFDSKRAYVKITDTYANGTAFTVSDFENLFVYNTNGLKALVIDTLPGYYSQAPNTNTLYVKYLNSSTYANGYQQTVFDPSDVLSVRNSANLQIGQLVVAANTSNANVGNPTGYAYAMTVTEGVIFKNGTFLYVAPQTVLVDRYDNKPDSVSVGFDAAEAIVTSQANSSLYDNSYVSPNYTAPGADRLMITPTLSVRATSEAKSGAFFSLADFRLGNPVTLRQTAEYSTLGAKLAQDIKEINGDFVVQPFLLNTQVKANTADPKFSGYVNLLAGKGIGYVDGYRVEYLNNNVVDLRKGTDYSSVNNQIVSMNFGYYLEANELCGEFSDSTSIVSVDLHNVAKTAVSSGTLLSTSFSAGTKIGTAFVRGVAPEDGTPGTAAATYRVYVFDVIMNPGYNFYDIKSIAYTSGSLKGCADVLLAYNSSVSANSAMIYDAHNTQLVYPFGQKAIKADGFTQTSFSYRRKGSTSFTTNGNCSITVPVATGAGTETFLYTGTLSSAQELDFHVVATSSGYSANLSGTVSVNTTSNAVIGSSTSFLSQYSVGDYTYVGGATRQITNISNSTYMTVSSPFSAANAAANHARAYPAGAVIPFYNRTSRTISATSSTATLTLGETLATAFNADVIYSVNRSSTVAAKKTVNKNIFVKINCANNVNGHLGPWSLGLPDVLSIDGAWISSGNNYANSGTNYASSFVLDTGQRDAHYDIASIKLAQGVPTSLLNSNSTITVQLTHFTTDTSQGVGFFTANSYQIDDANAANTNAIQTQSIPLYTSSRGTVFDLRDSVDFRPFVSNTAASSNTLVGATVNPVSNTSFTGTPYLPVPDSIFTTNLQYYLQRVDRVSIDTDGNLVVTEGIPSATSPAAPPEQPGMMTLGTVSVPPYPSLTPSVAKTAGRSDYSITTSLAQNIRFTMKDIGTLKKRIENLEYYTSLSLLESSASSLQVRSDTTGQNRFKNGIFVDPFKGFDLTNTNDPQFYCAIDDSRTELRPAFIQMRSQLALDTARSSGVMQHGELIMLSHTSNNVYSTQRYASKYRNCIEGNVYQWTGTIVLTPSGTISPDISTGADVVSNLDLASNWINLQNAWGTQWGNWVDSVGTTTSSSTTTNADGSQDITTVSQTTTTSTRNGLYLSTAVSNTSINLGSYVTNVSILPYLKAATIKFAAHGLKPNTRLYAYFGNVPVTTHCAPTNSSFVGTSVQGDKYSGIMGDPIVTDESGTAYGYFYLPANTFKSEENDFVLNDVSSLEQGNDAVQTSAKATFYGSTLSFSTASAILNTRSAVLTSDTTTQVNVSTTSNTTVQHIPAPAPAQPRGDDCGCGSIICTKLNQLGILDDVTYAADEKYGAYLREFDPDVYWGYIRWAKNVVKWIDGDGPNLMLWIRDPSRRRAREQELTIKITSAIALPWAQQMMHESTGSGESSWFGRKIMSFGKKICRWASRTSIDLENPSWITRAVMVSTFVALYAGSRVARLINK